MNRQFTKWIKRIGIAIGGAIAMFLIYIICALIYIYWYTPYKCISLYQEGISNEDKAKENAIKLLDLNDNKAMELLIFYAQKGNTEFQVLLGQQYESNILEYLEKSKKRNDWDDFWKYLNKETAKSFEKASYWYLQAAKKGNAKAQGEIGYHYLYGIGVKQNLSKALQWIQLGAENGDSIAQYRLGNLYLNGLALYTIDYRDYFYDGDGIFLSLNYEECTFKKGDYLNRVLSNPDSVYLKPNLNMAKHYWTLSAVQGCNLAKDALEKVYE